MIHYPRYLPKYPAILLVPAVLVAWAALCVMHCKDDLRSLLRPGTGFTNFGGSWGEGQPWREPLGFPFIFSGRWDEWAVGHYWWTGFQIHWFLIDLIIALTVAYVLAMGVERLMFPMIRGVRRRKLGQREAN